MIELDIKRTQGEFNLQIKCNIDSTVTGLFGPSGAGKSTLLAMIAGLAKPTEGHIILDGECLFDSKRGINKPLHQRRIGMVFQDSRLFPHLSVRDNLHYGYKLLAEKDRRLTFTQIVDLLEIGHILTQKPHELSGGEKQRVALGRALLTSPRLLLLDEPLASLDMRLKQQILPFLRRVKQEINIPMIYVSHAIDEILYLTTQLFLLEQGKLIAHGDFHNIMNQPSLKATASSMGLDNVICATVFKHHPQQGYTELKRDEQILIASLTHQNCGEKVSISIAANQIILSINTMPKISAENQLCGKVVNIESIDQRAIVSVDVSGAVLKVEVSDYALKNSGILLGASIYCLIRAQSIHVHGVL